MSPAAPLHQRSVVLYVLGSDVAIPEQTDATRVETVPEALAAMGRTRFSVLVVDVRRATEACVQKLAKADPNMCLLLAGSASDLATLEPCTREWRADGVVSLPLDRNEITAAIDAARRVSMRVADCVKLFESCRSMFGSLKQRDLVRTVVDVAPRVVAAENVALFLVNEFCEPEAAFECHTTVTLVPQGRGLLAELTRLVSDRGVVVSDDAPDQVLPRADWRWLACPLVGADGPGGAIVFLRKADAEPFSTHERQTASTFSATVAQALENARGYRELETKVKVLARERQRLVAREAVAIARDLGGAIAHEIANALSTVSYNVDSLAAAATDQHLWNAAKDAAEYLLLQGEPTGQRLASRIMESARGRNTDGLVTEVAAMIDECLEGVRRVAEMTRGLGGAHEKPPLEPRVPVDALELMRTPAVVGSVTRRPIVLQGGSTRPIVASPVDLEVALVHILRALDARPGSNDALPLVVHLDGQHEGRVITINDPTPVHEDDGIQRLLTPSLYLHEGRSFRFDASIAFAHTLLARNDLDLWVEPRAEGGVKLVITAKTAAA